MTSDDPGEDRPRRATQPRASKKAQSKSWGARRDDFLSGASSADEMTDESVFDVEMIDGSIDRVTQRSPRRVSRAPSAVSMSDFIKNVKPVEHNPVAAFSTRATRSSTYNSATNQRSPSAGATPSGGKKFHRRGHGADPQTSDAQVAARPESRSDGRSDATLESKRPKRKARDKVMDLLARRSYSALELQNKLKPYYEPQEIEAAIQFAEDNHWMLPPAEMAGRLSAELGRRKKGHRYINQYLQKKGLPPVEKNKDDEVEKALELIADKAERLDRHSASAPSEAGASAELGRSTKSFEARRAEYNERAKNLQKLYGMLASRGFDGDTISRALRIWKERQG